MVAAMCYAWLLENRERKSKGQGGGIGYTVVPVMNVSRRKMWKQQQAAWLFNNAGLDATSLLFADEVDLETLMMSGKLSILVIGQDVLKTNGEAGSLCTILTDNYCEDAYELLQTHLLKTLLLAGILLDTQNLNVSEKSSMTRDAEAVQLLLVGSTPNHRNTLFDQLMQEERDDSFLEALQRIYGKPPNEMILAGSDGGAQVRQVAPERRSTSMHHDNSVQNSNKISDVAKPVKTKSVSPKPAKLSQLPTQALKAPLQPAPNASRGKNKFFLAKWLGF